MIELLSPHMAGFAAAFGILFIAASSPGPAVAMLLGISLSQGRSAAMIGALGIAFGSMTINVLTLLGVGLLLSQAAWAMTILRLVGSAYLLWLAWGAFRKAINPPEVKPMVRVTRPLRLQFLAGYLLQVTNPKAIAFWLAIASIGATEGGGPLVILAFFTGSFLISFACHGAWALVLSGLTFRRVYARIRRWVEGALGLFFTFAAFKLATSRG